MFGPIVPKSGKKKKKPNFVEKNYMLRLEWDGSKYGDGSSVRKEGNLELRDRELGKNEDSEDINVVLLIILDFFIIWINLDQNLTWSTTASVQRLKEVVFPKTLVNCIKSNIRRHVYVAYRQCPDEKEVILF